MASPSFARYAALLAGVLDGSPLDGGCADAPADAAGEAGTFDAVVLDQATRHAACTLRRRPAAPPRARPSPRAASRDAPALVAPPPSPDARLDRRG